MNQQLLEYIKKSKDAGFNDGQIKDKLLKAGWQREDIEENLSHILQTREKQPANPITKPNRKIFRKVVFTLIGSVILLIVFFFAFPYVASIFSKDIPPPDDSDLRLSKIEIPDSQNAYFDLIKLTEGADDISKAKSIVSEIFDEKSLGAGFLSGEAYKLSYLNDQKFIDGILSKNVVALKYLDDAAEKPYYQDPITADPNNFGPNMPLRPLNSYRSVARVGAIKAAYLAKTGKSQESLDELMKIIEIGSKMQKSQGTLINYLTGLGIKSLGLEMARHIVQSYNIPAELLISYSKKLTEFTNSETTPANAFMLQYSTDIAAVDITSSINEAYDNNEGLKYLTKNNFYFKPNETKTLFADLTRAQIKDINCLNQTEETQHLLNKKGIIPNNDNQLIFYAKLFFTENAVGKLVFSVAGVSLRTITDRACNENLSVSALQTLMAIKAYKIQKGDDPPTLASLIPDYLAEMPKDPYDDLSLKYSKDKKIIYSVGPDKKDSGGSDGDDWTKMPDLTFKFDF